MTTIPRHLGLNGVHPVGPATIQQEAVIAHTTSRGSRMASWRQPPRPVFFHLLRGRAHGAVEGAVADVVVTRLRSVRIGVHRTRRRRAVSVGMVGLKGFGK